MTGQHERTVVRHRKLSVMNRLRLKSGAGFIFCRILLRQQRWSVRLCGDAVFPPDRFDPEGDSFLSRKAQIPLEKVKIW